MSCLRGFPQPGCGRMEIEQVRGRPRCGVCQSEELLHRFCATDRNMRTTDERFAIVECRSCGICQTFPQLSSEQAKNYYPAVYYPSLESSEHYYQKTSHQFQADKIAKLGRFRKSGKLLDVGCGVGYFVLEAVRAHFDAEGLEFSPDAASVGRELWTLKIQTGDFLRAEYPEASFEIVTLWQVFEHFPNPVETLRKVWQILKPGGLLVVAVPNIASIQASLFTNRWYHLDVPRHLFHYSPQTLGRLIEREGYQVKAVDYVSQEHNGAGVLGSVMRLWTPDELFIHKLIRKTIGRAIGNGLASIESLFKRGGTFTLFAEKK